MKRSTQLLLIGTGIGALALVNISNNSSTQASDEIEGTVYSTLEECIGDGQTQENCSIGQLEAFQAHQASSPKYEAQQDCENAFGEGQCTVSEQSVGNDTAERRHYFSPMLMGFMLGNMLSNRQASRPTAYPLYGCGAGAAVAGAGGRCFGSRNGSYFTTPASDSGKASTRIRIPSSVMNGRTANRTVVAGRPASSARSRGGFGASGRGFSFGG